MFKFKLTLFISVILAVAACTQPDRTAGNQTQSSVLEKVRKEGILHIGYITYPPTVIKDPNTGELSGHFVDAARFLAEVMNVRVEFHEASWNTFVADLQNGRVDLSIAATYRTIPRAMAVAFTRPLMYVGSSGVAKTGDTRFNSIHDLNRPDITIAVAQGEGTHEYAREHLQNANLRVLSVTDLSLVLSEVISGRADVALADIWTVTQFVRQHPEVVDLFDGQPFELISVGWAVRQRDTEWLNFVNTALDYLDTTGRLKQWEARYGAHWVHIKREYSVE